MDKIDKTIKNELSKPVRIESHYIAVPRFGDVVFVVKSNRKLLSNGRLQYEMAGEPVGRNISFVRELIHGNEPGIHFTYSGDGIISNWDWKNYYSKCSNGEVY